jgi:hypothetical protein
VSGDVVVFGDIEPEDGWDPDDELAELVDNLRRRVVLLRVGVACRDGAGLRAQVDELAELVDVARRRDRLDDRDRVRIRDLTDDLAHVYRRLDAEGG